MIVQFAMDTKTRAHHTSARVFCMCEGMSPRQVLAALSHDVVYLRRDDGTPPSVADTVQDVVDLITVVPCRDATVPCCMAGADSPSSADAWFARVLAQCRQAGPAIAPDDAQAYALRTVCKAVVLANRDVGSFAQADPGLFLSSTWLQIDESNAPLTRVGVYSLRQYRDVLMRMNGVLVNLKPQSVFQAYVDEPNAQLLADTTADAERNIRFACDFLDAKIVSVTMFLGDIRSAYGRTDRVEDFMPPTPVQSYLHADQSTDMLRMLEKGRTPERSNNLTASPLTAFVYRSIFSGNSTWAWCVPVVWHVHTLRRPGPMRCWNWKKPCGHKERRVQQALPSGQTFDKEGKK